MIGLVRLVGRCELKNPTIVTLLMREVGINKRLADVGATTGHYGAWAQAAQEDICLRSNPRTASLEQIVGLYAAAQ